MVKRSMKNKKGLFNKLLVRLLIAVSVIGCVVLIYKTEKDCSEKELEMTKIQEKIDKYEVENADLQKILNSNDMSVYIERVAVEERDYAYPDERRFYDTSRD